MGTVENVANAPIQANSTRQWFTDGTSASSALSDTKTLKRYPVGVCVLADGDVKITTPEGEEQTVTFGTGGFALGMFHPFRCKQVWATGTTVAAADVWLAEAKY